MTSLPPATGSPRRSTTSAPACARARDGWQGASNDEFDAACTKILALLTKGRENLVQLGVTNLTQHVEDSNKAETDMTSAMADLAGQLRMPL